VQFLGALVKLGKKATITYIMSVCLSVRLAVRPHGTSRLLLDEF